ncbi:GNAT family N-acetyltransferase [Microbacterium sp. NPDC076895]|uniref:GNAT family N-acetyltransferase n=1 Tax=Microbacterium sp. NPDC076895 TaxID=3154957 RepID=UPI0034350FEC
MGDVIRHAAPGDEPALHVLAAATFPLACPPASTPDDQRAFIETHLSEASFAGYLIDPDRTVLVNDEHGTLTGYTMLVLALPTDDDVRAALGSETGASLAELSKCYALPETHGSGTAARLLAATLDEARAQNVARVWLGVNQENVRARRFYQKHGFVMVGTKRFQVGKRLEYDYVLSLDL